MPHRIRPRWLSDHYFSQPSDALLAEGYRFLHRAAVYDVPDNPRYHLASRARYLDRVALIPTRVSPCVCPERDSAEVTNRLISILESYSLNNVSLSRMRRSMAWELSSVVDFTDLLVGSPFHLLEQSYKALLSRRGNLGLDEQDLLLIMLLGLACCGLKEMSLCKFCPRWAIPGSQLCLHHSQSKLAPGTPSEKAGRYRVGGTVGETSARHVPRVPEFIALTPLNLPGYVAQLLWRTANPGEDRTAAAIRHHIKLSPELQALVGNDFDQIGNDRLYRRLQEAIDPYEVRPRVWLWKIRRLRLWLGYKNALGAIPRKKSFKAWQRLVQASLLEKKGLSKAEIAHELCISRSAISNWLNRYKAASLSEAVEKHIKLRQIKLGMDRESVAE